MYTAQDLPWRTANKYTAAQLPEGTVLVNYNDPEHVLEVAEVLIGANPRTALFRLTHLADKRKGGLWYSLDEVNAKFDKHAQNSPF